MSRYKTAQDVLADLLDGYSAREWEAVEKGFYEWLDNLCEEVWTEGASNYYGTNPYEKKEVAE